MKKFTFVLAAALCMTASVFAEHVTHLNPYAYGVSSKVKGSVIAVTYQLNTAADSSAIIVYCNNQEVDAIPQPAENNGAGLQNAIVDVAKYTQPGTYTVGVRVFGTSYEAPQQLMELADGSSDTTAVAYGFDHPKGVDVDNDPFSPNFGRLLTAEAMEKAGNWHSQGIAGLYAFDPTFSPIANGNEYAFRDSTYGYALTMSDGKSAYAPYRIRISKDRRIFVSTQDDRKTSLYELSADLQTWTPIFNGSFNENGLFLDADGNYITGINCDFEVFGEGDDLEIVMLNCNKTAYSSVNGVDFMMAHYKLGTATSWNGPATSADSLHLLTGTQFCAVPSNLGFSYDENGGIWFKCARTSTAIQERGLHHVNAAGEVDFEFHATAEDSAKYHIPAAGTNAGAGCRMIDGDLYVGLGRVVSGCGHLLVYEPVLNDNGGVADLNVKYDLNLKAINTNLNDFAMDYAHNLYVVGNSSEKLIAVAMPYDGVVETPVQAEYVVDGIENVQGDVKVQKIFRNGQIVIIKNGVEYNALGAQL